MALTAQLDAPLVGRATETISTTRLLGFLLPMSIAMYGAFQGGQYVLLPLQLQALDAPHKVVNLAIIVMGTAIMSAVGMVVGGWATDITHTKWGGHAPWLLGMGVLSAVLFGLIGLQTSIPVIGALAIAFWFTMNFFQSVVLTVLTARTPERDRSFALALFAVAGPLGGIFGYNLVAFIDGAKGYMAFSAILLIFTFLFLVCAPESGDALPVRAKAAAALPTGARRDTLFSSFRRRDYLLAFIFRLALFAAQATILNYLIYYLIDRIGLKGLPGHNAEISSGDIASLRTICNLVGLALGMALIRKTSRRKIFLQAYALLMGAAMLAPVFWPTWTAVLIYGALGGFAWGVYSTIDLLLMHAVLPNPETRGRDLGMLAMAGGIAQLFGPPLATVLIHYLDYSALFEAGAVITLAGGIAAGFLKSVR